jgi:hypothetical protein
MAGAERVTEAVFTPEAHSWDAPTNDKGTGFLLPSRIQGGSRITTKANPPFHPRNPRPSAVKPLREHAAEF